MGAWMGKGFFLNFLDDFQFSTKNATISNCDISINLGYHGNLKNVSFIKEILHINCKKAPKYGDVKFMVI